MLEMRFFKRIAEKFDFRVYVGDTKPCFSAKVALNETSSGIEDTLKTVTRSWRASGACFRRVHDSSSEKVGWATRPPICFSRHFDKK